VFEERFDVGRMARDYLDVYRSLARQDLGQATPIPRPARMVLSAMTAGRTWETASRVQGTLLGAVPSG